MVIIRISHSTIIIIMSLVVCKSSVSHRAWILAQGGMYSTMEFWFKKVWQVFKYNYPSSTSLKVELNWPHVVLLHKITSLKTSLPVIKFDWVIKALDLYCDLKWYDRIPACEAIRLLGSICGNDSFLYAFKPVTERI